MIEKGLFGDDSDRFAFLTVHLLLAAVRLDIAVVDLPIGRTRSVVTEVLCFILLKVQGHGVVPLPDGLTCMAKATLPHNSSFAIALSCSACSTRVNKPTSVLC